MRLIATHPHHYTTMSNNTIILHLTDDEVRALRDAVYVARYNSDSSSTNTLERLDEKLQLELGLLTPDFTTNFSMETRFGQSLEEWQIEQQVASL